MSENITASMQVMNEAMPKLISLYVAVSVGSNNLPFNRWKRSYENVSCSSNHALVPSTHILNKLKDYDTQKRPDLCARLMCWSNFLPDPPCKFDDCAQGSSNKQYVEDGEI